MNGARAYEADPYDYADARLLMDRLELAEPVAIALVRRGHRTEDQARSFLEAETRHDPDGLSGIAEAVGLIDAAIDAGRRITVHGDYDVDGMAATAILVTALRGAGAECDWLIPDRSADGYGLTAKGVERLRERGTGLLVTADCGITSVAEIAAVRAAGIEAIVTDHHTPGDALPECPIVHPRLGAYPFDGLCGAAVADKLARAFERSRAAARGCEAPDPDRDLDLVALATVADMVPLVDENRTLTRLGLRQLRLARRPGLRALIAAAGVEPERLDEGDIAFRLAPRLNAAGRLYRADAGVELLSTEDEGRAAEIASELDSANLERREVERAVTAEALACLRELPDELREAPGLILAGEGWHPGVVGIAASRIVERTGRPAVLLAIDANGRARGSGRGIPGFDLLTALGECAELLDRFGGHRAAAGVELDAARIDELRAAFAAAAGRQLPDGPPIRPDRIDAVVAPDALDSRVAEQIAALGPFGEGNPAVRLLVPWARAEDVRPMGEEGKHARFSLAAAGGRAGAVVFNGASALQRAVRAPHDFTVRLELNHWNGAVEPRAVLEGRPGPCESADALPGACACADGADAGWWRSFDAHLALAPDELDLPAPAASPGAARRQVISGRRAPVALAGELVSSGARVLIVTADARRRAELAPLAAGGARFGSSWAVLCAGCDDAAVAAASAGREEGGPDLLLTDWEALVARPDLANGFEHAICVDPAPLPAQAQALAAGPGWLHEAYAGDDLALRCWEERWQPRAALAEIYRGAAAGPLAGEGLGALLAASGGRRREAALAARCVRVLVELGICEIGANGGPEGDERLLRVVSSKRTELDRSGVWRASTARYEEGLESLRSRTAN